MPKGFPLTEEDQYQRRREVFDTAIALFLQKGFHETTMREIALNAGIPKSTLYDSFQTKDEILTSFMEEEVNDLLHRVRPIADKDRPSGEKLREIMLLHLQYLIDRRDVYLKLTFEFQRLSAASQRRIQVKRHEYQDLLCCLIEDAVREGSFRPVSPLLAVHTLLSMLPLAIYTTRPTGTPEQMMNEVMDIFYHGVVKQI